MRYAIVFLFAVTVVVVLRLAMGQQPELVDAIFAGVPACAAMYVARSKHRFFQFPKKPSLLLATFGLLFPGAFLTIEVYRIYEMFMSGRLLISTNPLWYVSWSERPVGFILAIVVHMLLVLILTSIAVVSALELKKWYDRRRGSAGSF